jgi:CheY-like chemotaxis protein
MSKTALVVDDSKSARFALRKFLEGFNYQVETAENANEAYAALARGLPDVVFMDHIMPGVDGFEALRTIKANAQMASVPVVICSSNEGEAFVAEAHARGASGVLQKPPSPEQIAGLLANLTTRAPSTLPSEPQDEHPLARTLAPAASAPRDPTQMERLMATIPPKLIPTAHLVHQTATVPPPSNPPPPIISALPITSPKVQPLREPAVTIQQAVMKSIRDSMQGETLAPLAGTAPSAPAPAPISLGAMPSLTASSERSSTQDLEEQLGALRQQLDRKSTRLNSSHRLTSRMPSSA